MTDKTKTNCGAEDIHFNVDTQNRLHMKTGADFTYDAAGNMTLNANAAQNYSYDPENRILTAGGSTYTYDAEGNRVKKASGSTGTLYWYGALGVVAESDLSGNVQREYVFFDGTRVARREEIKGSTGVFYYFSDRVKTTDIVTDAQGNIKNESDFYPWGGELQFANGDANNHYKFTGKERDLESGLDYFEARYYANVLGRWVTPDWAAKATAVPYAKFADPQTLNLYGYVKDAPLNRADEDGHQDVASDLKKSIQDTFDGTAIKNSLSKAWDDVKSIFTPSNGKITTAGGTVDISVTTTTGNLQKNSTGATSITAVPGVGGTVDFTAHPPGVKPGPVAVSAGTSVVSVAVTDNSATVSVGYVFGPPVKANLNVAVDTDAANNAANTAASAPAGSQIPPPPPPPPPPAPSPAPSPSHTCPGGSGSCH